MPRVYKLALKKGLHALEFDYQIKRADFGRWRSYAEFEWEGPGLKRRELRETDLYHSPAKLKQLAAKVQPLQPRTSPPEAAYEGRPLWYTKEDALKLSIERKYINVPENKGLKVRQH